MKNIVKLNYSLFITRDLLQQAVPSGLQTSLQVLPSTLPTLQLFQLI